MEVKSKITKEIVPMIDLFPSVQLMNRVGSRLRERIVLLRAPSAVRILHRDNGRHLISVTHSTLLHRSFLVSRVVLRPGI